MSLKHWLIERPTVNIAFTIAGKLRKEPPPPPLTEQWVIVQVAGGQVIRYWRGSSRKAGTVWTTDPERACLYASRAVALYDAIHMNQKTMKHRYEVQRLR
jgi:hypothetical protein